MGFAVDFSKELESQSPISCRKTTTTGSLLSIFLFFAVFWLGIRLEFNLECQYLSDIHQLNEENQRRMKGIGRYNSTLPIIRQLLCFPPLFSLAFVSPLLQQRDARQCNSVFLPSMPFSFPSTFVGGSVVRRTARPDIEWIHFIHYLLLP